MKNRRVPWQKKGINSATTEARKEEEAADTSRIARYDPILFHTLVKQRGVSC
jgi:hypothetical protein